MDLHMSLEKILHSGDQFGDLFYEIFFESHPEAKKYFDGIDMKRQSLMLTMALKLMGEYHAKGYAAINQYLEHLGTRHSDRGVPQEVYTDWSDSLLTALSRFHGKDWNETLAEEWRDAVVATSKVMFNGYDKRVGL
jgi:hemoglobin-like flavoprotein